MSKYNGWTNYATWRIDLEIFDGSYDSYKGYSIDDLKESVENFIEEGCDNETTLSYARAFLDDVNFQEIAEHIGEHNEAE